MPHFLQNIPPQTASVPQLRVLRERQPNHADDLAPTNEERSDDHNDKDKRLKPTMGTSRCEDT
jgi:hypothetical protein